jgi:hypothetical protein
MGDRSAIEWTGATWNGAFVGPFIDECGHVAIRMMRP